MCRSKAEGGRRCPGHGTGAPRNVRYYNNDQPVQNLANPLSKDEKAALRAYSDKSYRTIREHLYDYISLETGKPVQGVLSLDRSSNAKTVASIDSALAKAEPFPQPVKTYRSMTLPSNYSNPSEWLTANNYVEGGTYQDRSFMSTTLNPEEVVTQFGGTNYAKPQIILEITTRKGLLLSDHSKWSSEQEVLLPRDTPYKIAKVYTRTQYNVDTEKSGRQTRTVTLIQLVDAEDE